MAKRVIMFIDGSNLYHGMRSMLGKINLDYEKFISILVRDRDLIRVYYYLPIVNKEEAEEQYKSQQRFISYLQDIPNVHVKFGRLIKRGETLVEKTLDVLIAIDMVKYAYQNQYDIAILVSGDGDFSPAIEAVKEIGKQTETAFFPNETSIYLRHLSDRFIELNEKSLKNCLYIKEENDL
jgi:uncharacterized LabA/DUF88 family protein